MHYRLAFSVFVTFLLAALAAAVYVERLSVARDVERAERAAERAAHIAKVHNDTMDLLDTASLTISASSAGNFTLSSSASTVNAYTLADSFAPDFTVVRGSAHEEVAQITLDGTVTIAAGSTCEDALRYVARMVPDPTRPGKWRYWTAR